MSRVSPEDFIHHFPENGLKLLLHDSANLRDLVTLRDPARAVRIDFDRVTIDPTTYIAADYRHLASDLVVKVPYRTRLKGRRRSLTLYILIEHQSKPDPIMVLRMLEYLVQIYKGQLPQPNKKGQKRPRRRRRRRAFRFYPVLPIVFYTGERTWEALTPFVELVEGGAEDFADILPHLRPLFLNLSAIAPAELEASGGALGWVLELLRLRHAPREEFHATTVRVAEHLIGMAETERDRCMMFLSYLEAMIYHDRTEPEREPLRDVIRHAIRSDPLRREVEAMWKTMAQVVEERERKKGREEGALQTRRLILERQLRHRFGRLARSIVETIRTTDDVARLDAWLDAVVTAETLAHVGITAPQEP